MLEAREVTVPIFYSNSVRSWPKCGDLAKPVRYLPLPIALCRLFSHDAHMAAYSTPHFPRRLSREALSLAGKRALPDGVFMVLAIFDGDCPATHGASGGTSDAPAPDAWWNAERPKLEAVRQTHRDLFVYRTRGGFRLLGLLPEPSLLREPADAAAWSLTYLRWCAYLARRFAVHVDPSCKDWQRLYRLPHATRIQGRQPEDRDTLGDPRNIGSWVCEPTVEDIAAAQVLYKRNACEGRRPRGQAIPRSAGEVGTGEGVLLHAFRARGWLGQAIAPGKITVACPWEHRHSKGQRFDSSTILFLPEAGDVVGWFHCSHAHCAGRGLRNVLGLFTPPELHRAAAAAGVVTINERGLRATQHRHGIRTIAAREVTPWRG